MSTRPLRPCSFAGCPELVESGRCATHARDHQRHRQQTETWRKVRGARGGQVDIYTTKRWRDARAHFLMRNPLCVDCRAEGRTVAATDVDHQVSHGGDMRLFWDRSNWAARCHAHHSAKTMREVVHAR